MLLPLLLAAAGVGFGAILLAARKASSGKLISYTTPATPAGGGYVATTIIPKGFTAEIIASAIKWAKVRGVPAQEILATIYVESRGNPRAWANLSTEDSRGLMQVNVNAWASKLQARGYSLDDLWDIDKNIEIGSEIYANYRQTVQNLIAQSGVPQSAPIDVLTRLYYKGPAYVKKKILAGEDASHPYNNAEAAVQNWKVAMDLVRGVTSA
jgi:soluble lytic murein transglycosylase-like protein